MQIEGSDTVNKTRTASIDKTTFWIRLFEKITFTLFVLYSSFVFVDDNESEILHTLPPYIRVKTI